MKSRTIILFFLGFLIPSVSVRAYSLDDDIETARRKYRETAVYWTGTGAALGLGGGLIGLGVLASGRNACKGVEGECYDGLESAIGGTALILGGILYGSLFAVNGIYRYTMANQFSELQSSELTYSERLNGFNQAAQRARTWRHIGASVSTGIGLGLTGLVLYAGTGGVSAGDAAFAALVGLPYLAVGAWSFLNPSIAEDVHRSFHATNTRRVILDLDILPMKDGLYSGIRLNF